MPRSLITLPGAMKIGYSIKQMSPNQLTHFTVISFKSWMAGTGVTKLIDILTTGTSVPTWAAITLINIYE